MIFNYKTIGQDGVERGGSIEASNLDAAVVALQKKGLIVSSIHPEESKGLFSSWSLLNRISTRDVVVVSRQIATMFNAQVSAMQVFRMLATDNANPALGKKMNEIANDIQAGNQISVAMAKHDTIFSTFYISMVRSGEESGKLKDVFNYLADHLERTYDTTSKVRSALIYPAFVATTFIVVMLLMFTMVIPKIASIIKDSGQVVPIYTTIVMGISQFVVDYGLLMLVILAISGVFLWQYAKTNSGQIALDDAKVKTPYVGPLYRKLYLSRMVDNMNTLLISGVPMVRALELTSDVVDNRIYEGILRQSVEDVKAGRPLSDALSGKQEIPMILINMIKVGEETGELGSVLKTMANFYRREVLNQIDVMVGMIEPVMIVGLGVGVGVLLASVLMPIYNISSGM
jgi:type IV pilus assembly protein PilC